MQLHGSLGTTQETPLGPWWAAAPQLALADGPTEVHKATVAKGMLRDYQPAPGLFPTEHIPTRRAAGPGPVRGRPRGVRAVSDAEAGPAALFDLTGKVALVTGGSRGLGREMVLAFAERRAPTWSSPAASWTTARRWREEIEAAGRRALPVACHVGHWDECDELADRAYEHFGKVDVLVNNAGMSPLAPSSAQTSEELFDKVIGVNFKGPFRLSALIGQRMYDGDGGSIINVSSSGALFPAPRYGPYAGAKAALNALTGVFAREYAPKVRVNTLSAGPFLTDIAKHWPDESERTWKNAAGPPRDTRGGRDHGALPGVGSLELHHRLAHPRRRRPLLTEERARADGRHHGAHRGLSGSCRPRAGRSPRTGAAPRP